MSKPVKKAAYRIRNRAEYNQALVKRGSLTVWVDEQAVRAWHHDGPPRWGAKFVSSDTAIRCLLTLRAAFHLPPAGHRGARPIRLRVDGPGPGGPPLQHLVPPGRRPAGGPRPPG